MDIFSIYVYVYKKCRYIFDCDWLSRLVVCKKIFD